MARSRLQHSWVGIGSKPILFSIGLTMKILFVFGLMCLATCCPFTGFCQDGNPISESGKKIAINVLFVGDADTERSKDFQTFLNQHFEEASFSDVSKYSGKAPAVHDVVILDSVEFEFGGLRDLPQDEGRPTILVSTFGGSMGSGWKLRTGWC